MGSPPLAPLALTDLFACALPQPPGALSVVSLGPNKGYVLVAMLRAWAGQSAKIATIDPTPLIEGANQARLGVIPDAGAAGPFDAAVPAGSLAPCTVLGATELSGALPASWTPGPAWPDGVPYVDGGVNLADAEPSLGPGCTSPLEGGTAPAPPGADGGIPFAMGPAPSPSPNAMTMRTDVPVLYVSDGAVPVVHVIDLSDPTSPREEPPLLATSLQQPTRRVSVGPIAISPPTHDFHVYLYAGDTDNGSLMVYDVTDPASASRSPMVRPHAELNPFQPPDRIAFSSPVAALSFVTHDWPLPQQSEGANPVHQLTGLLCDPSPNAHPDGGAFVAGSDGEGLGAYYRADQTGIIQAGATVTTFPTRLRGVFGFATLSSGTIVAIDVDDWDAPCRRPDPMALGGQDGASPDRSTCPSRRRRVRRTSTRTTCRSRTTRSSATRRGDDARSPSSRCRAEPAAIAVPPHQRPDARRLRAADHGWNAALRLDRRALVEWRRRRAAVPAALADAAAHGLGRPHVRPEPGRARARGARLGAHAAGDDGAPACPTRRRRRVALLVRGPDDVREPGLDRDVRGGAAHGGAKSRSICPRATATRRSRWRRPSRTPAP